LRRDVEDLVPPDLMLGGLGARHRRIIAAAGIVAACVRKTSPATAATCSEASAAAK
jgi:hypothetical protein